MSSDVGAVRDFLESWKPYAELPPGNPARRTINRFIESDDAAERAKLIARTNLLYQLHELYEHLEIRRQEPDAKTEQFARLMTMPVAEMAAAIDSGERRPFLELLQAGFEFGRSELQPRLTAVRRFMLDLWALPVGGLGMKYSIYPNGVLFASGGLTHDEMARKFNLLGLGQGQPQGGGELQRLENLTFAYDTASTAFGSRLKPEFVKDSVNRWMRLTGGQADKITLNYSKKLGV